VSTVDVIGDGRGVFYMRVQVVAFGFLTRIDFFANGAG